MNMVRRKTMQWDPWSAISSSPYTNSTTPTVSVLAVDAGGNLATGATVYLDVNFDSDGDFTDDGEAGYLTGTLSAYGMAMLTFTTALAEGAYALQARVSDTFDNEGTSSVTTLMVDTTPPTLVLSMPDTVDTLTISGTVTVDGFRFGHPQQ